MPATADSGWRRTPPGTALALGAVLTGLVIVQVSRTLRVGGVDLGGYLRSAQAAVAGSYNSDSWENSWPPFFSLLLAPLALAARQLPSFRHVVALWLAIDLAATVALVAVAVRAMAPGRRPPALAYLLTALLAAPWLRNNLFYGQINTSLVLLCTIAFALLGGGRDAATPGVLVGIAASAKVQAALLVPWFLLTGRRRALCGALVTGVACAVAPALLYGPRVLASAYEFWVTQAIPAHQGGFGISVSAVAHHWANVLAGAPLTVRPRHPLAEGIGTAVALAVAAALYWAIARSRQTHPPAHDLALLQPAAAIATPLSWRYHLVALVPTYAALSVYLLSSGGDARRRRAVTFLVAVSALLGYASELGAVRSVAGAVTTAERLGSCVLSAWAAIGAALVARGDERVGGLVTARSSASRAARR